MEIDCKYVVLHLVVHTVSNPMGFAVPSPIEVSPSRRWEEPNLPRRSAMCVYRNETIPHPPIRTTEPGTVYVGWEWDGT